MRLCEQAFNLTSETSLKPMIPKSIQIPISRNTKRTAVLPLRLVPFSAIDFWSVQVASGKGSLGETDVTSLITL